MVFISRASATEPASASDAAPSPRAKVSIVDILSTCVVGRCRLTR